MSKLECYSDHDRHISWRLCECGAKKPSGTTGCARCRFLDGEHPEQATLIGALRGTDGMSISELVDDLQRLPSALSRSLALLLQSGRVRRYWREADPISTTQRGRNGAGQRAVRSNGGHWVYALNGRFEP